MSTRSNTDSSARPSMAKRVAVTALVAATLCGLLYMHLAATEQSTAHDDTLTIQLLGPAPAAD